MTMDSDLDPQRLMDVGLDPQTLTDLDLDPKKTMDFALFGNVCCEFLFPFGSRESMASLVERSSSEDPKRLPHLRVILYEDLVQPAWGWDRLLPWMNGYVLFEDYFRYLEQYFLRNIHPVSGIHAAAAECVEAEDALSSIAAGHGGLTVYSAGHHELSKKIKEQAMRHLTICPDSSVTVPAACLVCIAEEARLMSELFRKWITVADDLPSAELLQRRIEFVHEVREVVLDILTTYRGPYSKEISAAVLGTKREAIVSCELLQRHDVDHEERLYICVEIREFTLELLKIIRDHFPRESAIDYRPIDRARAIMESKRRYYLQRQLQPTSCHCHLR